MRVTTAMSTLRWAAVGLVGLALVAVPGSASAWSPGDTAPVRTLSGPATGLQEPSGLAFDAQGRLYVADSIGAIRVYASGASGDVAPRKTLSGDATGLVGPTGVAFDAAGRMYVANASNRSITAYAPDWASGNTAPIKTLSGDATGLVAPVRIAFDASGQMYVADVFANAVSVFAANWADGDQSPVKYLGGINTGLNGPSGLAFDTSGQMYVTNAFGNSVTVYSPDWAAGDTPPVKVLEGPATGIGLPADLAFDFLGRMSVVNSLDPQCNYSSVSNVTQWPSNWASGDTPPTEILQGENTRIRCPHAITFSSTGQLYVANQLGQSVTVYGNEATVSIKGKRTAPTGITLTGVTSEVPLGTSITAYVRLKAPKQKFVRQRAITLKQGDLVKGTFTYPITKLTAGKAYEVYVMIGTLRSATITVNP